MRFKHIKSHPVSGLNEGYSNGDLNESDLEEFLETHLDDIKKLWADSTANMEIEGIEVEDEESFVIEWTSNIYNGALPQRISYYLDDFFKEFNKFIEPDGIAGWWFLPKNPYKIRYLLYYRRDLGEHFRYRIMLKKLENSKAALE